MTKSLSIFLAAAVVAMGIQAIPATAESTATVQTAQRTGATDGDGVYGWQLMSEQERAQYRDRMRNAASAAEREQIRIENHERMQARARSRGVELPDEPRQGRGGKDGMGQGRGPMDDDMRRRGGGGGGRSR